MCSFKQANSPRKGIAMLAAVGVLFIIGLLAVQFHQMSREAQLNAYKFQASEVAQQLAESAMDEAFTYVYNQTGKAGNDLFNNIVNNPSSPSAMDCTTGNLEDKNTRGVSVPVPLTINIANSMNMANRFEIEVTARIIDFRNGDDSGKKFYGNEGVGTLELRARVEPREDQKKYTPGACTITRHHDYKVVSIVSKRSSRPAGYVQNQLLDYTLFVTRGREEFETTNGSNLNPQETRLTIDQSANTSPSDFFGKIYLGGTSGSGGKPVFIDITSETKDFIPTPLSKTNIAPPSPVDNADCLSLVTSIKPLFSAASKQAFDEELQRQGKTGDARYKNCVVGGIQGNFSYERHPMTDEAIDAISTLTAEQKADMKIARKGAWVIPSPAFVPKDPDRPFTPGLKILPIEKLTDILQGKVRKRFFHFGYFVLDMTNAEISVVYEYKKPKTFGGYSWKTAVEGPNPLNDPTLIAKYKSRRLPSYPNIEVLRGGEMNIEFQAGKFPDPDMTSKLVSDYDYLPGTAKDTFPNPTFYNFSNSMSLDGTDLAINEFRPFSHAALWIRRDFPAERLAEYGIYKNGELHLRGIVRVYGTVNLKGAAGSPLKVFGQGVLIADEITIESGIVKGDSDALCVLAVRGADKSGNVSPQTIFVKTDEKIEASLIAVGYGHGCRVVAENNKLDLFGALAVDRLDLNRWKKAVEHKLVYDPMLASDKDLYAVNISRWISFKRIIERDE